MKQNGTKTIPYCSSVNNKVIIIKHQGENPSSNTWCVARYGTICTILKM